MPSKWIDFVKSWAAKNNMSYTSALKDCKCKEAYRKENPVKGGNISNPELYEKAKKLADEIYDKPSAYKSGFITKKYKDLGGSYDGSKPETTGLSRWFKEEWKDIGNKEYPVYRPTKRITKDTPLTLDEIEPSNLKKQIALKQQIKGIKNLPPFEKIKTIKGGALSDTDIASIAFLSAMGIPLTYLVGIWAMDKLNELVEFIRRGGRVAPEYDPADFEFAGAETKEEPRDIEGGKVSDWVSPTAWKDYGTAVVYGRNDYPPKMRDIIKKYGKRRIIGMYACRTPVPSLLTSALNVVSFGEFGRRWADKPYDELFHLDLRVELDTNPRVTVLLEKNEVLNAIVNPPPKGKNTECTYVSVGSRRITIEDLLAGSQQIQGDKFFKYSAYNNNCQDFIVSLLNGSSLGTQDNFDFIKQDTQELFKGLPGTRKTANTVTDLGAVFNTIIEGAGRKIKGGALDEVSARNLIDDFFTRTVNETNRILQELQEVEADINLIRQTEEFVTNTILRGARIVIDEMDGNTLMINMFNQRFRPFIEFTRGRFNELLTRAPVPTQALMTPVTDVQYMGSRLSEESLRSSEEGLPRADIIGDGIHKGDNYYVQSVVFKKDKFDVPSSRKWLKENKYMTKKPDVTDTEIRWRQVNPKYIEEKGYKRFRTKKIGRNSGISLIIAYK